MEDLREIVEISNDYLGPDVRTIETKEIRTWVFDPVVRQQYFLGTYSVKDEKDKEETHSIYGTYAGVREGLGHVFVSYHNEKSLLIYVCRPHIKGGCPIKVDNSLPWPQKLTIEASFHSSLKGSELEWAMQWLRTNRFKRST